jgi:hypothetical protein
LTVQEQYVGFAGTTGAEKHFDCIFLGLLQHQKEFRVDDVLVSEPK